ncbi:hypothetical protein PBI_MRMAGOO_52 [Mycobacterium phage MrMagoo]|uniref:Lipoprotein n=1 Tax=Mycobacterium phage MrMagoo TaxID=1927020 RepID=A0A1L6BYI7_9CAUD|nr:hypothetical protein J4U04_gp052 [Mycobacterium phage MrMagoo]APQ42156.1 hypothetical protein PBI_MRMAGOO_52 [Mycobacterium phage MrMagoo]ARM70232.1 hypothetical protein SEA_GARDENSALSA_52 [Mycobacterium phage GardenSalsa]
MTKKILLGLAAMGVILGATACDPSTDGAGMDPSPATGGSGLVLTPKGGIGIDLGGGMTIDPTTGGIGFGVPLG